MCQEAIAKPLFYILLVFQEENTQYYETMGKSIKFHQCPQILKCLEAQSL